MKKANENDMLTVGEAVLKTAGWFERHGVEEPRLDAELLLAKVLGCNRLQVYLDWQKPLMELEIAAYRELMRRRGQDREPVWRIIGEREFYGRKFVVTPSVFIPRPETEGVAERALTLLEREPLASIRRPVVFEVGTGSGCLITTVAAEKAGPHYIASDISKGALATARQNAERHDVDSRIEFRQGSLFAGFDGSLELVISNPPYIPRTQENNLPPEVSKWDPEEALYGGEDGLEIIRGIAAESAKRLIRGGWVVLEIGDEQGPSAAAVFKETGKFGSVRVEKDLGGRDRYLMARMR